LNDDYRECKEGVCVCDDADCPASWDVNHYPIEQPNGRWMPMFSGKYSECFVDFATRAEAEAWIEGYDHGSTVA
jgi:hypothetical protein